jgi:hypothetical protein
MYEDEYQYEDKAQVGEGIGCGCVFVVMLIFGMLLSLAGT